MAILQAKILLVLAQLAMSVRVNQLNVLDAIEKLDLEDDSVATSTGSLKSKSADDTNETRGVDMKIAGAKLDTALTSPPMKAPLPEVALQPFLDTVHGLRAFVEGIRGLYYGFSQEVPFHNLDHANNIEQFATWYARSMKFTREEELILRLSAFSHDVMHPGTRCPGNNEFYVGGNFLSDVREKFKVEHNLGKFASDVFKALKKGGVTKERLQIALGHGADLAGFFNNKSSLNNEEVFSLMLDRAPQEVLHAWVTKTLLEKHNVNIRKEDKAKVLLNILMTSISLQFKLRFAPIQGAEEAHVRMMCEDEIFNQFQCGLLLHLLDMGWITQKQCVADGFCQSIDGEHPSFVFGPRFQAESGFYKGTASFETFAENEKNNFIAMVEGLVSNIFKYQKEYGINFMNGRMLTYLGEGASEHRKNVGDEKFKQKVTEIVGTFNLPPTVWMSTA